ncbi:MAG: hypothetical protein WC488_00155 [Candidatus Micrarchaeia archaeon]
MKKLMLALLLVPLAFAQSAWQDLSIVAILASVAALGILFAVGYGIESNELKFLAKEELFQVMITAVMVAGFIAVVQPIVQGAHISATADVGATIDKITDINGILGKAAMELGKEGSKSIWCSFSAAGFGVSSCSGFRMLGPALSLGFQLTATALAELQGMMFLMDFAETYIFTLFFPLGLFMRTFKYTRGAGGLLMAVGLAFYVVMPITYSYLHGIIADPSVPVSDPSPINVQSCDHYAIQGTGNENAAIATFQGAIQNRDAIIRPLLYYAIMDATLCVVVSLAVAVISIRYLSSIAGAEVDVHALGRLI